LFLPEWSDRAAVCGPWGYGRRINSKLRRIAADE
jgi:hypothetical protein